MGAGTWLVLSLVMGSTLFGFVIHERQKRTAPRWEPPGGFVWEGILCVHRLVFFSGTSRRCSRGVQAVCQPGFPWKRKPDRDVVVKEKPLTHSNRQGMHEPEEGRPPVFKSWNTWYWLVLGLFILQVIIYYFITSAFL